MNSTISHFQIIGLLGQGGRGEVYKAVDSRLQRVVALKVLHAQDWNDSESRQSLILEARRAAGLNHPHVATMYELGKEGDRVFFAMEFVEGETLDEKIRSGRLSISAALDFAIQIVEGLKAAHARGLVHCDLKPRNVMVDRDGNIKILDFGFCRVFRPASQEVPAIGRDHIEAEQSGALDSAPNEARRRSGTLHYLSPEQARGERVDARTDLFSFGVLLYELVTGRRPFERNDAASTLRASLDETPPAMSAFRTDVPLELENIVLKTLEKERADRYPSAEDLLKDLAHVRRLVAPHTQNDRITAPVSADLTETIPSPPDLRAVKRVAFLRHHRRTFAIVAGLALAMVPLDYVLARPNGVPAGRLLAYLAVAVLCASAYGFLKKESRREDVHFPTATAFRGLLPFLEADRDHFYGRETDQLALFNLICHREFRFGVLHGESGCGKTSLLRAGLIPKLWEEGYLPIYCRTYKDPLGSVIEECRRRAGREHLTEESPLEFLRRLAREEDIEWVLLFDQFEEFFTPLTTRRQRESFLSFVADACNDPGLPIRFLFSLRSDFIYLVNSEFEGRIPDPLRSSRLHHLRNFDEKQAAGIIERSVVRAGLQCEEGLSRVIAHDLAEADTVLPSELQIIGERIQNKRLYTIQAYRQSGGKEPLVYSFLEDVIQVSEDPEGAKLLLRSLISDENMRLSLPLDEISKRTQRSGPVIERILCAFVEARLVREIQDEDPWRYELMHEYLIGKINEITGRVLDATQRANRLFRQYLSNFVVDERTRIPLSKLWFIHRHTDIPFGAREEKLLKKSWRWGGLQVSVLGVTLFLATVLGAAALSVNATWDDVRLSDGHTAAVRRAIFSPDGQRLISCGEDGKVVVWDFARRQRVATLVEHHDWVTALAYSPDGRWFASGSLDHSIIIWDAHTLTKQITLPAPPGNIAGLAFSHDGTKLAAIGNQTFLWNVEGWKLIQVIPQSSGYSSITFSLNDNQLLFAAGVVWEVSSGRLLADSLRPGFNWGDVSPDGSHMVGVDTDGAVSFWRLMQPGAMIPRQLIRSQRVHQDHGRAAVFSPDGTLAATGSENIVLWDARTHTKLARLEHPAIVWSLAFSPDGQWLVSTHGDGAILLWNVAERERTANFNEHSGAVRAVAFSNDGKRIASASEDQSIIIWDAERKQKLAVLLGHKTRVTAVAFAPDDSWLASCDQDGMLILWDLERHQPRQTYKYTFPAGLTVPSYCLAISPDGRWVAFSQGIYDVVEGRLAVDLTGRSLQNRWGQIYGMDYSSDGSSLVFVTDHGEIVVWNVRQARVVAESQLEGMQLIAVSFSPDGKWCATVEDSGHVRLWGTQPLRQIGIVGQHSARIKSVAFSPDGQTVASSGDDQTIALWDVRQRRLITRIGSPNAPVLAIAFSPDGRQLVSGGHDKSVHLYTRHRVLWGHRLD